MAISTPTKSGLALRPALLDRAEQVLIVSLWSMMVARFFHAADKGLWLVLLSETAVMVFVIIRRPTEQLSLDLGDWLLAITATAAPLLVRPGGEALFGMAAVGQALVIVGNVVQASAKLALRRSFGIAPANRGVKVSGPYRFMRHPMYGGYLWVHIGALILMPTLFNCVVYAIGWCAQLLRLKAEERLLAQDPAYRAYAAQVRWRLLPGIY